MTMMLFRILLFSMIFLLSGLFSSANAAQCQLPDKKPIIQNKKKEKAIRFLNSGFGKWIVAKSLKKDQIKEKSGKTSRRTTNILLGIASILAGIALFVAGFVFVAKIWFTFGTLFIILGIFLLLT